MKVLAVAAVAVVLLAGCGGSSPSKPAGSIQVTMTEFKFDPSSLSAPHGKVVFYLVNGGTQAHDLVIRDSSNNRVGGSDLISAGDSSVLTVDNINAGTYTIVCTQPGHESSGMKGTLTIT